MEFSSDNTAGASQPILEAIIAANDGHAAPYGADTLSLEAERRLAVVFEHELACFLVPTGTAANALALGALCPPWGAVFCHEDAHVIADECGAPEMFTAGGKLVGIEGVRAKITPEAFTAKLAAFPRGPVRQVQPAALSLSQVTEAGTLYRPAEISALSEIAHAAGLAVHMDGARFANALVALGCTPAEMTWKAGIDVLSFGATKNGAWACEAVLFFDPEKARDFIYRRKRGGHTVSKSRLLGAQMTAYLDQDHWLDLARIANARARRLAEGIARIPGLRLAWPCEANEVFVVLSEEVDKVLQKAGGHYYTWDKPGLMEGPPVGPTEVLARLVTSFATKDEAIDQFLAVAAAAAQKHA
ncbi:threonine aldolase family protein [Beijerinckia indica]|uniref:L-threonine aldolase n=1 Tax=Beijerinckia indica subsp. indica (strain ATCC 9039 / DSM 1715 / NCIMB 8712) TaxID=395963 RepID=B2IBG5_BEII9|nr:beta-eliminating lyase-related protein [Beijerinckia indica]ACB96591.1 Threonine aldolase [Beijerinckia indica subsp. indica ATCC 9039]